MAFQWKRIFTITAALLGAFYLSVELIDPARGTSDVNERLQKVVVAAHVRAATSPFELSPMEVATIQPAAFVERLRVTGELRPSRLVELRAIRGGRITRSNIREGQRVRAGDVLIAFESNDLQAGLNQKEADQEGAMAEMVLAMQSLNRIEQLASKRVASQEQLDKARSEVAGRKVRLDSQAAQVEIGRTALQDAEILAPFDGVVSKLLVHQGAQIPADAELLTLVDVSDMEARVLISTQEISRVAVGQVVELQVDGLQNQAIKGEVARISPVADDGSRSVAVHVRLPDEGYNFKGGMFVQGSILVRQTEGAITVPVASLLGDKKDAYVLKLTDGVLLRQPVTIISRWDDGQVAEVSGLSAGDLIVRTPHAELRSGVAVTVAEVG
ncbi:efflux RND transporter periplasmic adaptor subunit [Agrobacterium sp. a22-2]|uniref:efflux RND transporter periplasmic adaptor subunit n=1 Tax=Agrobacterium sp. a22-2 TaxID=2283840 RepID=UPI0014474145|nr:efflux RND transporter periplasmic adaptor subunit [Agrobacterium sp. a22-2]NKN38973.1 efflux RND transporter periplasmic adaptor subunit [Agrobacterium sp. a22-2]